MKEELLALSELIGEVVKKYDIRYFTAYCFNDGKASISIQEKDTVEFRFINTEGEEQ